MVITQSKEWDCLAMGGECQNKLMENVLYNTIHYLQFIAFVVMCDFEDVRVDYKLATWSLSTYSW